MSTRSLPPEDEPTGDDGRRPVRTAALRAARHVLRAARSALRVLATELGGVRGCGGHQVPGRPAHQPGDVGLPRHRGAA
ncbi:hypothetical protein ACWFR0_42595, partial [Streptomyces noursei]